ncbi:hypothetical protein [Candidatus Pelagibacter bacterium nBUS_28]|uniref:hypothetical protein n=1 Tax=Candidatus Pelagibacter bacterium nBUS_28 TaxID=3374189 RepID=UPI003EB8777C
MKIKINWSGKAHKFDSKVKKYLLKVLDSDNLTQGREKDIFEIKLRKYLKKKIFSAQVLRLPRLR